MWKIPPVNKILFLVLENTWMDILNPSLEDTIVMTFFKTQAM
jgi:hypothetical protein